MKQFSIIAALDEKAGIGKGGKLAWRLPADLVHFKEITLGPHPGRNVVIMGRRTWESLPSKFRPLPGRLNIVLSRTPGFSPGNSEVVVATDFQSALSKASEHGGEIFIIGGSAVFAEALSSPDCAKLFLTRVAKDFGCDSFFPEIPVEFVRIDASKPHEDNGLRYHFETYERT